MTAFDAVSQPVFHLATPTGRGAVSTIIINGSGAMDCVNRLFRSRSGNPLNARHFGRIVYGYWIVNSQPGEDLIVCPRNDTWLEVHCHGGESAAQLISETLVHAGAIAIGSHDLAVRISGSDYLADLTCAISKAQTPRTAKYLLAQPRLHRSLWQNLLGHIEMQESAAAIGMIEQFLAMKTFGKHLVEPWSVVFCGAPNVGKSSLINALLGFQRSIVHPIAGTTRDMVEAQTALDSWPVRLFDTAGIRDSDDTVEQLGIESTWQSIHSADLVILVIDASGSGATELQDQIVQTRPDLVIANKSDLVRPDSPFIDPSIDLPVSAKTGIGLDRLIDQISQLLVPQVPELTVPIPVTKKQIELFDGILNLVKQQNWRQAREDAFSVYETIR